MIENKTLDLQVLDPLGSGVQKSEKSFNAVWQEHGGDESDNTN